MSHAAVLTVPGYTNAGPQHWMSRWEKNEPTWRRVQQRNWDAPVKDEWVGALRAAIAHEPAPPVLVAHSLGCIAVAHLAASDAPSIAAAFLVAPADVEQAPGLDMLRGFGPVPLARFDFPVAVVASMDDPYVTLLRAKEFAVGWGAAFHAVGAHGHLNSDSGLGEWAEGRALFDFFLRRAGLL